MTRRDVRLRTSWFGYRKLDVINCIEHLCALSDAEERLARETQQGLQVQQSTPPPQETVAQAPAKPKPKPVQKTPPKPVVKAVPKAEPWVPRTELERLSVELMDQMTRLMTG